MPPKLTEPEEPSTYEGMEVFSTEFVGIPVLHPMHTRMYTNIMPIVDANTKILPGIRSGHADFLMVGDVLDSNRKTLARYVQFTKVSNDHVDEAIIIGELSLHIEDLRNLVNSLKERLANLDSQI